MTPIPTQTAPTIASPPMFGTARSWTFRSPSGASIQPALERDLPDHGYEQQRRE